MHLCELDAYGHITCTSYCTLRGIKYYPFLSPWKSRPQWQPPRRPAAPAAQSPLRKGAKPPPAAPAAQSPLCKAAKQPLPP